MEIGTKMKIAEISYIVEGIYYEWRFNLYMFPTFVKCFFLSHDEKIGYPENYEPAYCARCNTIEPTDDFTLPTIKENIYWFFVKSIEKRNGK